jgi:hypothetical protein
MTQSELAECWAVTKQRVGQLCKEGKLRRGEDGKVDTKEAFRFRASQLDENQARALFQTYGNAHGSFLPKFVDHMQGQSADEPLSADEVLGIEAPVAHPTPTEALTSAVGKQSRFTELRIVELETKLHAAELKRRRDAGEFIETKAVYRAGREVAAEIVAMLNTLPLEVAALLVDPELKREARERAERVVDRCIYAMQRKFNALARVETDEDDDV